jgi:membrane-associated phospholipid phosphatase
MIRAGLPAVLFALLALFAGPNDPPEWEDDVVEAATDTPRPLGAVTQAAMQLGTQPAILATAVVAFLAARPRGLGWRAALAVLVAGTVVRITNSLWKEIVSRPRPDDVPVRDHSADGFGFPSGHAATAFVLATVLAVYLPARWRWIPFVLAALAGIGRMYVGVHFPLDVVGGALWGVVVGTVVVRIPWFTDLGRRQTPVSM